MERSDGAFQKVMRTPRRRATPSARRAQALCTKKCARVYDNALRANPELIAGAVLCVGMARLSLSDRAKLATRSPANGSDNKQRRRGCVNIMRADGREKGNTQ